MDNDELSRIVRYLHASTLADADDYESPASDDRWTLETVSWRLARVRGATPAPISPPAETAPIFWRYEWERDEGSLRACVWLLLRWLRLYGVSRNPSGAARARRCWRAVSGQQARCAARHASELLFLRMGELGWSPAETLATLFAARHAADRWARARLAYAHAAIDAAALILSEARAGRFEIWGAPLGEWIEFGDPGPIPRAALAANVAISPKLNAVKPAPGQPQLSPTKAEYRECFMWRGDAMELEARTQRAEAPEEVRVIATLPERTVSLIVATILAAQERKPSPNLKLSEPMLAAVLSCAHREAPHGLRAWLSDGRARTYQGFRDLVMQQSKYSEDSVQRCLSATKGLSVEWCSPTNRGRAQRSPKSPKKSPRTP